MDRSQQPPPLPEMGSPPRRATVCPYCGHVSEGAENAKECEKCRGLFEPLSRQASQNAMGPWYIRDEANPFRPGCSYETMKMLVARKRIGPETVMRGPSTRQFWMCARNVPGVAHLLGECHSCHRATSAGSSKCGGCGASFAVEDDRQYLGLAEVRVVPGAGVVVRAPSKVETGRAEARELPRIVDETRRDGEGLGEVALAGGVSGVGEPEHQAAFEPIRHPARPARGGPALSDAQIDEMLQRERQAARYGSSRGGSRSVIIGLIIAAVLGIGVVLAYAAVMMTQNVAAKGAGGAGGAGAGAAGGPVAPVKPVAPGKK